MKIRTLEELNDKLSEEIGWRKKELAFLHSIIDSNRSYPEKQNALIRIGISVLYAHWEGFIKASSTAYLDFILMQGLPYQRLKSNFIALGVKGKLNNIWQTKNATTFIELINFLLTGLSERCSFKSKESIYTRSNLSSVVFKEIICMLNLDYSPYVTKEKLIDEKLLYNRNNIAHGKYVLIDIIAYIEMHMVIINLMDIFKNQLENAALTQAYLRN